MLSRMGIALGGLVSCSSSGCDQAPLKWVEASASLPLAAVPEDGFLLGHVELNEFDPRHQWSYSVLAALLQCEEDGGCDLGNANCSAVSDGLELLAVGFDPSPGTLTGECDTRSDGCRQDFQVAVLVRDASCVAGTVSFRSYRSGARDSRAEAEFNLSNP